MAKVKTSKNQVSFASLRSFGRNKKIRRTSYLFIGLLIIILGLITWYEKAYSNPEATFWGMVSNNLATKGVSKEISQTSGTSTANNITQVVFTPTARVRYVKSVTDSSTKPSTSFTLEGIGTPSNDYQRYSRISKPVAAGKSAPDYSKIYAAWLREDTQQSNSQLFSNAIFSAVLFGNLPASDRHTVVTKLRGAYNVQYSGKSNQAGRRIYSYDVAVNLKKYADAAKSYAKSLGLPGADQISPSAYAADARVELKIKVDVASRQISSVEYKSAGTTEKYLSYGAAPAINLPSRTLTNQEFQQVINSLAQ